MFTVNEDNSIYATRGDIVFFGVTAEDKGQSYTFQPGDVVRIKIYGKKDAENVVLQKDFPVTEATESVEIFLTEADTKIGEVISKATDYWYEVELNPYNNPQTIIGYDEDGAKIFKLFPEGDDIPEYVPTEEEIGTVDTELNMVSTRPVQNQAIARAVTSLGAELDTAKEDLFTATSRASVEIATERARIDNLLASGTASTSEVKDIRVGADGVTYGSAGSAVRHQFAAQEDMLKELEGSILWRSPNVFNPDTVIKNKTIDIKTGEIIDDSTGAMISEFIRIPTGATNVMTSYVTGGGVHQHQYLFLGYYDADKKFLLYQENSSDYPIPTGAKWLIICIGPIFATAYHRLMLEFGTTMSEFSQYGEVELLDSVSTPRLDVKIDSLNARLSTITDSSVLDLLFSGNKKIKLIGDSITHGVGGSGFSESGELILDVGDTQWHENTNGLCWANMLKEYIESKFPTCTVKNFGTKSESYYSMVNTSANKLNQLIEGDDDLVVMMFGTNDRIHSASTDAMIRNASEVIEYITKTMGKSLVLMTSLPASVNDETMSNKNFHMEDVDMVNSYLARKYGLHHISIFREFNKKLGDGSISKYLSDGLHPNDLGYKAMFEIVCDKMGIATKIAEARW